MNECLKPMNPEERAYRAVNEIYDRFLQGVPKSGKMYAAMAGLFAHHLREFAADHASNCVILKEMEHAMEQNPKLFGCNKYE